jgi:hypothetical protein
MAYRSVSTNNTPATPLVVTPPASIADGDILIAFVTDDDGGSDTMTWPAGFVELTGSPVHGLGDGQTFAVALKVASGESGNYSITSSGSAITGGVACWSGRDGSTTPHQALIKKYVGGASPLNMTTDAFAANTSVDGCDMIYIASLDGSANNAVTYAPPASYTERVDINDAVKKSLTLDTLDNQATGQDGVLTGVATFASGTADYLVAVIALAPGAGGGGGGGTPGDPAVRAPLFAMLIRA